MLTELLDAMRGSTLITMISDAVDSGAPALVIDWLIRAAVVNMGAAEVINELCDADVPERYWPELETD